MTWDETMERSVGPLPRREPEHELRHATMTDGTLTPACTCGWYSPNRQHSEFERHLRRVEAQTKGTP